MTLDKLLKMENSKNLLCKAMNILKAAHVKINEWAVGGGTVLAYYYNHRISKDIDIFINDIQLLGYLSPRLNDFSEAAIDYDEMTNYISLTYPEGKIDFIVGSQLSAFAPKKQSFLEKEVFLEDPVEIVAKKIFYRSASIKVRDIFDLAVVANDRVEDLVTTLKNFPEQVNIFFRKLDEIQTQKEKLYSIYQRDSILPGGLNFIGKEIDLCYKIKQTIYKNKDIPLIELKKIYNTQEQIFIRKYNDTICKGNNHDIAVIEATKALFMSGYDVNQIYVVIEKLIPNAQDDDFYSLNEKS